MSSPDFHFPPGVTVISGPSGVGKNTIINVLLRRYPQLHLASSLTTRQRRPGDIPGRYEYVGKSEFMRRDAAGELLEWAEYSSNYYGTLMPDANDHNLILEIDYQGAAQVRMKVPGARLVFIKPPGDTVEDQLKVLQERLHGRSSDDETAKNQRLVTARRELELGAAQADLVVVNQDIEETTDEIAGAMFSHLTPHRS